MLKKIYRCFPNGRYKVLTMSYDDGKIYDRRLVSIFNKYGIKGTFHINYGHLGDKGLERLDAQEVIDLYQGHEISAHTMTHPTIGRCPHELVIQQILEDRKGLEQIVGTPVRGLSYPNGSYDDRIKELLPHLGIKYARIVGNSDCYDFPRDPYEWMATCHHNHRLLEHADTFVSLKKPQYLSLLYVWGHSIEFEKDNNWDMIENFCEKVGNQSDIWYATNIEIVDYLDAWERLQFAADLSFVYNPSALSLWMLVNGKVVEVEGGELKRFE